MGDGGGARRWQDLACFLDHWLSLLPPTPQSRRMSGGPDARGAANGAACGGPGRDLLLHQEDPGASKSNGKGASRRRPS